MRRATLLLLIAGIIFLLVGLLWFCFHVAPIFTLCILCVVVFSLAFVLTEHWKTHDAAEFENRFWTAIAAAFFSSCVFAIDSPLKYPASTTGYVLAWFTIVCGTFAVHNYDRYLRRQSLSKVPSIKRVQSAEFAAEARRKARATTAEIRSLVASIDQPFWSSTFQNLFLLPRVLYVEHQIIQMFKDATSAELNMIIANVGLGLIFYKVKDHRIAGRNNRTELMELLCVKRVGELNVSSKAIMIDALQRMKLSAHPLGEHFAKTIIMKTTLDSLSELKCLTDSKGDYYSMHRLIYVDIRSQQVRKDVLAYIASQARVQNAHSTIGSKAGKKRRQMAWRKIVSDVDDTMSCSGGSWPAGIDRSYPKKCIYPGVLGFYRELDIGQGVYAFAQEATKEDWQHRTGNLAFLSARPHVYKDVSESVTYGKICPHAHDDEILRMNLVVTI